MYREESVLSHVFGVLFGLVLCLPFFAWVGIRIYNDVIFDREIGGHIKRAADANSIALAKQELEVVVAAMERRKMTDGYTSILYTTPDEDVGFWYKNIKSCLDQINALPDSAQPGERDLVLMKLRQTLLDHKGGHESITVPTGISIYPHNTAYFLFCLASIVGGILGCCIVGYNCIHGNWLLS